MGNQGDHPMKKLELVLTTNPHVPIIIDGLSMVDDSDPDFFNATFDNGARMAINRAYVVYMKGTPVE